LGSLGQGATFCTVKNCKKSHRSNVYHVALPGELYVTRTAETAFVDPVVKTSVLNEDLLERWKEMSCALDEWATLFRLVDKDKHHQAATNVKFYVFDLNERDQEESNALAFKTPRKRKQVDMLNEALTIPPFAKSIEPLSEESINPDANRNDIFELDARTMNMRSTLEKVISTVEQERATSLLYFESSDARFSKLSTVLGSKPNGLDAKFEAPNLWLTVGSVAEEVCKVSDAYSLGFGEVKQVSINLLLIQTPQ